MITFKVTGTQLFPYDMLRYDECFPATEQDSAKIEALSPTPRRRTRGQVEINLKTALKRGPTDPRWQSFGWTVQS